MALEPGTLLGRYQIVELSGRGGMGEVYRARDMRLDRDVAIKVLPAGVSEDSAFQKRFEREARTISQLQHPNICTLHDVGSEDGVDYLVMEYLEGETLEDRLQKGAVPIAEALRIGGEIAQAIEAAHRRGVVHRDLKPGNVMLTPTGTKVLDFGLARDTAVPGEVVDTEAATMPAMITEEGQIVGTMPYMAPEQLQASQTDSRTDIWALGCILYEMAAGDRPFGGKSRADLIASILGSDPEPPSRKRPLTPQRLDGVVRRCLEKDPERRWQSARDLAFALATALDEPAETAAAGSPAPSLVVLPFTNRSPDPDNEYFSDGLTDEIIADLSKIEALRVISRSSAMRLKGTDKDLKTIGRELNVCYVLDGTVRKAGDSLRITAELIDATDDIQLWAEKYGGTIDDVFDIQERVSREIVDSLKIALTPDDDRQIAERPINDIRAYEYYLRAKHEILTFTEEGLDRGIDLLLRALDLVGENALLYSALGMAYWQHINAGVRPDEQYLQQAEECAGKVFQLAPESAEGHHLRGLIGLARGEVQKAADAFKHALALDPGHASALLYRSAALSFAGREATAEAERLLRADPLTPFNQIALAWAHLTQGRFSQALDVCRRWFAVDADNPLAALFLGDALARNGRGDEAGTVLRQLAQRLPQTMYGQLAQFLAHALSRERDEALEAVTPTLTESAHWDPEYSWEMATGFALINEKEEALEWLEKAMRRGFINYPFISRLDPLLANLREEEGFLRLMEEMRARWEHFEV